MVKLLDLCSKHNDSVSLRLNRESAGRGQQTQEMLLLKSNFLGGDNLFKPAVATSKA